MGKLSSDLETAAWSLTGSDAEAKRCREDLYLLEGKETWRWLQPTLDILRSYFFSPTTANMPSMHQWDTLHHDDTYRCFSALMMLVLAVDKHNPKLITTPEPLNPLQTAPGKLDEEEDPLPSDDLPYEKGLPISKTTTVQSVYPPLHQQLDELCHLQRRDLHLAHQDYQTRRASKRFGHQSLRTVRSLYYTVTYERIRWMLKLLPTSAPMATSDPQVGVGKPSSEWSSIQIESSQKPADSKAEEEESNVPLLNDGDEFVQARRVPPKDAFRNANVRVPYRTAAKFHTLLTGEATVPLGGLKRTLKACTSKATFTALVKNLQTLGNDVALNRPRYLSLLSKCHYSPKAMSDPHQALRSKYGQAFLTSLPVRIKSIMRVP